MHLASHVGEALCTVWQLDYSTAEGDGSVVEGNARPLLVVGQLHEAGRFQILGRSRQHGHHFKKYSKKQSSFKVDEEERYFD